MVKASVVWLNYNSMGFIDVVLRSLGSFLDLDFDGYELIVVDNASTDGSFERIKKFIEEHKPSGVRVKIVRNERNLGYAGGMNVGWEARDSDSKYVAFVNNDLIATPQSLAKLIEYMEGDEKVAATSGLIKYPNGKIYSAGWSTDDILTAINICGKADLTRCPTANRPHEVTYADGAYYLVRVDAVKRFGFDGKPFIDETFLYADDALLGIRLWNFGYATHYVPVEAGIHYASLTTRGTGLIKYYPLRAKFIAYAFIKTIHYSTVSIYYARIKALSWTLCKVGLKQYCTMYKAVTDGWELGMRFRNRYGFLDLNKAPHIKLPTYVVMAHVFFPIRSTFLRNRFVTHDDLVLTS
ncbi:glycosyltransferase [Vulcanisaeta distributa]|uniref:Glycosyl transferase family 2 n=1 Tax=Vulcanisaeta distributa (strain DSM 14429 / JCM 11212 / NBRC 100878 / IC-017) TaxID=572478 RepID=E1QP90_VULDI|nr:glycosyltransferase family 2 protein [Vulcanisaeta distributa]ADN50261.1 glycosyl transferase family 2 [Vulcanisaeta distributa DSM 14429]